MKQFRYIYKALLIVGLTFSFQSCFQDMEDNPPFDYPKADESLVGEKGESFYVSFDENFNDHIYSFKADVVGTPTLGEGKVGSAYQGAEGSYILFGGNALLFKENFSISFWYKYIPDSGERAGIVSLSPPRVNNGDVRTSGLRIFREGNNVMKVNVGFGTGETTFNGKALPENEWSFITVTASTDRCIIYINGEEAGAAGTNYTGISWTDVSLMSIGSGEPRFHGWNHKHDLASIDELRMFEKALTPEEIKSLMDN